MAAELFALMWVPFLMCLVLTGIHAYLGIHVLAREVVFVDIALAQIAALGATTAFVFGFPLESWEAYGFGLAFTILGALVLALTRTRERHVSQEAVIGVVYAVSSAAAVLVADRTPHGMEHLRGMLVGSILSVTGAEVLKVAGALRHDRSLPLALPPALLPHLDGSGRRLPGGPSRTLVGLPLLRLVRHRGDELGPHRRRPARLLLSHRARAGRHHPRRPAGDAARSSAGASGPA